MATFNCQCGKELENSKNGDIMYVFKESEVLSAHQQAPGIGLREFLMGWRNWADRENSAVVYWKCPDCGKVYEAAPRLDGEVYRVFEKTERKDEVDLKALAAWDRVFVLTTEKLNELENSTASMALFDVIYLTRWDYDFFLDPTEKMVLALDATTNVSAFVYEDVDKK